MKKEKSYIKWILLVVFFSFLMTPFLFVSDIEFIGNSRYKKEEYLKFIEFEKSFRVLDIPLFMRILELKKNPYVEDLKIGIAFPNKYKITLKERKPVAYIPYPYRPNVFLIQDKITIDKEFYTGVYLYLDKDGRVLESSDKLLYKIPIIQGLCVTEFKKGEIVDLGSGSKIKIIRDMSEILSDYLDDPAVNNGVVIDLTEYSNIKLYTLSPLIEVLYGEPNGSSEKIRKIIEIMKNIPNNYSGTLDIRDERRNPSFMPLT